MPGIIHAERTPTTLEFNSRPIEISEIIILGFSPDSRYGSRHFQTNVKGILYWRR